MSMPAVRCLPRSPTVVVTIGFDNLAPIICHKIANARHGAAGNGAGFLGEALRAERGPEA